MSEQENNTPAKPKVGSLRDRIAAFEKSAQNDNTPAQKPLAPRAKPGPISWKPSTSPKDEGDEPSNDRKHAGMSADDAKESIAAVGGLKARMAALQGSMNNAGSSPATPPVPASKPMRKQFVPRPPTPDEENEEGSENKEKAKEPLILPRRRLDNWDPLAATAAAVGARQRSASPPSTAEDHRDEQATELAVGEQAQEQTSEQTQEQEQDEEAKERERRAALAARMARLGGARIGMAPPIIPKKPKPSPPLEEDPVKANYPTPVRVIPVSEGRAPDDRVQTPIEVKETGSDTLRTITVEDETTSRAAPLPPASPVTSGGLSERRSSSFHEETSSSQTSSQTSLASSGSHPGSIPLPAMPRRAAPPRSKHSARSLKTEQASYESESSETKVIQDATDDAAEEKTKPEVTGAVQDISIAEGTATPQRGEHYEDHEESNLTEQVKPSSYEGEKVEEVGYNADLEEEKEGEKVRTEEEKAEEEVRFKEEVEAVEEEKFVDPKKTEEENEETEEAEEQVSHLIAPQEEEEEIAPPPPPRRQQSAHSTISSSKESEPSPSTRDGKHFFPDTAGGLDDS